MHIALLTILITYQAIMSILDKRDIQKYTGSEITEKQRIKFYKEAIVFGWIPVWIILLFVGISPLTLWNIGFRAISFSNNTWLNIVIGIISGVIVLALGYQTIMYFISAEYRSKAAAEISSKKDGNCQYDNVVSQILIPKSKTEKKWFLLVSLTAGICEELVWRGCLIFLLSMIYCVTDSIIPGIVLHFLFDYSSAFLVKDTESN